MIDMWKRNRNASWAEFVLRRVAIEESGCWRWTGGTDRRGYGRARWQGHSKGAHRASYESLVGPIPDGLELDHLCRNPLCVNPDHLEPVTGAENMRRSAIARNGPYEPIVAMYRSGMSSRQIADAVGINRGTVLQRLRACGEPIRPAGTPRAVTDATDLALKYQAARAE